MPAPSRSEMNQGVLQVLRTHLAAAEGIQEFDFQGPEYTSTIINYPVGARNDLVKETVVEGWFFSVRKKRRTRQKLAHKARVAAGAGLRGALTAADTTMNPFPPGFAPTSGMASELVGEVYAVRPGTNISTHLYHDRTWTGGLVKIFDSLGTLGHDAKMLRRQADAMLKEQVHRAEWPAFMVRIYTILFGNRGTRPMRGYHIRRVEAGQIPPFTRDDMLTKGFPQMALKLTPYWWDVPPEGGAPGPLLPVGPTSPTDNDLQDERQFRPMCEPQFM